jgi:hypothetical protein
MEFKATMDDGVLDIKCIAEKKGNNIIIHVPSFPIINKLKKKFEDEKELELGIRNI